MELIKFKSNATPEQKKKFDDHVKNKKHKDAWKLVQSVTGVKLHKSVTEQKVNPDILSVSGAGQDGDNFDRYENELKALGEEATKIDLENKQLVEKLWEQQLGIQ
jgi:hypothetical protein